MQKDLPSEYAHLEPLLRTIEPQRQQELKEMIDETLDKLTDILYQIPKELALNVINRIIDIYTDIGIIHSETKVGETEYPASRFYLGSYMHRRLTKLRDRYNPKPGEQLFLSEEMMQAFFSLPYKPEK